MSFDVRQLGQFVKLEAPFLTPGLKRMLANDLALHFLLNGRKTNEGDLTWVDGVVDRFLARHPQAYVVESGGGL